MIRLLCLNCLGSIVLLGAVQQEGVLDQGVIQQFAARAIYVRGQVTRLRDEQPWALSSGERVPIRQVITTGADGYARFEVSGGSSFEIFSNSRVAFRQNANSPDDLLDLVAGRVKVFLKPAVGQTQLRVFTPAALITARESATIALALDEDETVRIDVTEGQIGVQHRLLPNSEPTVVRAVDAILVQRDQPIARRMDRGSLYRYAIRVREALSSITSKRATSREATRDLGSAQPGAKFMADTTKIRMPATP